MHEDAIGERLKKDQMGRSVIKYWRVRYGETEKEEPEEEPEVEEAAAATEDDEAARIAMEIYERLQAEAAADDAKLLAEQEAAYAEAAAKESMSAEEAAWRERTGASGVYGQNAFDNEDEAAQVAAILSEKKDAFADMLESMKEGEQ